MKFPNKSVRGSQRSSTMRNVVMGGVGVLWGGGILV
jgi:hypothetical protein